MVSRFGRREAEGEANRGWALALLCAASFLAVVDVTIVTIALPSIQRDLDISTTRAQWILSAYALAFGGLLLLSGRLGDLHGRRRMFCIGLAIFGAASVLGGIAGNPWLLIAARVAQGIGGAALVPASLALVTATTAEGAERDQALGLYGAMAGVGFVVGMLLGGVITEFLGWRWVFFVNVPVVLALLTLARSRIPESRGEQMPGSLDLAGAVTVTFGLGSLLYTVSSGAERGWNSPDVLVFGASGLVLLLGFIEVERRAAAPILPLRTMTRRAIAAPNLAVLLLSMVGVSQLFALTLYIQQVLGRSPLQTGLAFVPMTLASVVASPFAGRLTTRLGARQTSALGFVVLGSGLLALAASVGSRELSLSLIGAMVVAEGGFMIARVPLTVAATGAVGETERGLAAGLMSTFTEVGNAFGWALVAAVIAVVSASAGESSERGLLAGLWWSLLVAAMVSAAALAAVLLGLDQERRRRPERERAPGSP